MRTCGIIAEYNPLHNGHIYHITESRRLSGADYIIVLMSGSFVQRGAPAFLDKYQRAKMALLAGADLVLELPALFSCGSSEDFASASISILSNLGVVDSFSFGLEEPIPQRPDTLQETPGRRACRLLKALSRAARILSEEPPEFSSLLQSGLKKGLPYPEARSQALEAFCQESQNSLLNRPNNILALEYLKALYRQNSPLTPLPILRMGEGYHSPEFTDGFCSATALRGYCENIFSGKGETEFGDMGENLSPKETGPARKIQSPEKAEAFLRKYMPEKAAALLADHLGKSCPILADDFSDMLSYQLLSAQDKGFTPYLDVSRELSGRILKEINTRKTFSQWAHALKTRQYTYTRVSRCLCHILLQIPGELSASCREKGYADYARILGFRKNASPLLKKIQANSNLTLLTRMPEAGRTLTPMGRSILRTELFASQLYRAVQQKKFPACESLPTEYTAGLAIL